MRQSKLAGVYRMGFFSVMILFLMATRGACEDIGKPIDIGFPHSFADLAEKVKPAVVNISTTSTVTVPGNPFQQFFGQGQEGEGDQFNDFFKHFSKDTPDKKMKQQSLGSGFITSKDGYIITNNHVVDKAEEIKVKLSDGREFKAKVIGRDETTDIALIKITDPSGNLPILSLGTSEKMRVGDWVLAIGNPFGLEQTVTQGIISATGRVIGSGPYDDFLQTDAPINPGNSGGPLVNLRGEVIGINTAIFSGGQGLGFAIPSTMAKSVTTQLKENGKVVRGYIGVTIQSITPELAKSFGLKESRGALVGDVVKGGPAEKGGVRIGDAIVTFDGRRVKSSNDLPRIVAETPIGKTVDVVIIREGKEHHFTLKVEELNKEKISAQSSAPVQSFGMKVDNITPQMRQQFGAEEKSGVIVVSVEQGSMADIAGIQQGDVIKEVNRKTVRNLADFNEIIAKSGKGEPVLLLLKRDKQTFFVTLESQ
jgi:serine protease Do